MSRGTLLAALLVTIGVALGSLSTAAAAPVQTTDPEYLDDAGRIIGSPDPGPSPEHPGDRGGYAQLLTLGVMASGVAFIGWRVTRQLRH